MGNKRLYRKLLLDFGAQYIETASDIRTALEAKDFEQVHSLVHNLKGLAGNLEAKDLQVAAVNLEKLVKGAAKNTLPVKDVKLKFSELENALDQALASARGLRTSAEENVCQPFNGEIADIPADLAKDTAKRIRNAAEMGDVASLSAIAEEIRTRSDSCKPLSKQIIQLAEDFEFDGILKLADELDAC